MARIVIAAVATPGHVYPMLKIAQSLIAQGHQVTVFTGALFRQQTEALSAQFIPFDEQVDFDYRHLEQHFPDRAQLPPGNVQMALAFKNFFSAPIPLLDRQLRQIIREQQADLLIAENCFYGILPLLQEKKSPSYSSDHHWHNTSGLLFERFNFLGTTYPTRSTTARINT